MVINEGKEAGKYSQTIDGLGLSSGVYVYKLNINGNSGEYNLVKKFVLLK